MTDEEFQEYSLENPIRSAAMVGLLNEKGDILLMRSTRLPSIWLPFGGGIDPEDSSPGDAAVRELREEIGLEIPLQSLRESIEAPYDFGEGTIYFYTYVLERSVESLSIDTWEVLEHRWFTIDEALNLPILPAMRSFLSHLLNKRGK